VTSRREFLTAFKKPLEANSDTKELSYLRPPYAKDESLFQNRCIECESKACATSCEEKIIVIASDGLPILNFSKSGCTFCDECAMSCDGGVLKVEDRLESINARFIIDPKSCVSHHGVICFSCKEPCIDDAILFNGMFNPVIDDDRCTGCGFCLSLCPTKAIRYDILELKGVEGEFEG
jgi:ferredoxin-type protein NapF